MLLSLLLLFAVTANASYYLNQTVPLNPTVAKVDISVVYNGYYFLSDRTNFDVVVLRFQPWPPRVMPSIHVGANPNGIAVSTTTNEIYVGLDNSTLAVVDARTLKVVAMIGTGGTNRCDEMSFDPINQVVLVANPDDDVPFVSFISVTSRKVLYKVVLHDCPDGVEASAWNPSDGLMYVSAPSTTAHPGGEVKIFSAKTGQQLWNFGEDKCNSKGLDFNTRGDRLFMTCGNKDPNNCHSLVYTPQGTKVYDIPGLCGGDESDYDPATDTWFTTGSVPKQGVAIVNGTTGKLMQILPDRKSVV